MFNMQPYSHFWRHGKPYYILFLYFSYLKYELNIHPVELAFI
ncbi:hypothetical protein SXCC_03634 [Gluconacetobacter sp. SXCC-1]|nr:hypothetical protein SXCC_03634 [Gluconacetobacter sp. SXCC-1]